MPRPDEDPPYGGPALEAGRTSPPASRPAAAPAPCHMLSALPLMAAGNSSRYLGKGGEGRSGHRVRSPTDPFIPFHSTNGPGLPAALGGPRAPVGPLDGAPEWRPSDCGPYTQQRGKPLCSRGGAGPAAGGGAGCWGRGFWVGAGCWGRGLWVGRPVGGGASADGAGCWGRGWLPGEGPLDGARCLGRGLCALRRGRNARWSGQAVGGVRPQRTKASHWESRMCVAVAAEAGSEEASAGRARASANADP